MAFMLEGGAGGFQLLALGSVDDWIVKIQILHCVDYRGGHHQPRVPFLVRGTTYQGACGVAVCRIISSYAVHVLGPSFPFRGIGG